MQIQGRVKERVVTHDGVCINCGYTVDAEGYCGCPSVSERVPTWLRRMQEQGLPDKDLTGQIKVA